MKPYPLHAIDAMVEGLRRDGLVFIPAAFPEALAGEAIRRIDALTPQGWDESHAALGRGLDRYLNVFNRDPFWLAFLDRPGVIELVEAALGADCHIIGMTAWRTHPGYRGDALHVDYLPPSRTADAPFLLSAHFHLHDVTPSVGPTRVIAGSHRAARAPRAGETTFEGHAAEPTLALAGDVIVFRSDLWHSGSDNTSRTRRRYLLQVHYGRREMAQHFSPYLDWRFNPVVIARASPRQRRLLGEHPPAAYD